MGADIIKVERPESGDDTRHWGPPFLAQWSAWFLSANRNKRSIAIDLRSGGGSEVLERLLNSADVLIESFNPVKLVDLGLAPEHVRARHRRLIYCTLSGFGLKGPDCGLPGYDLIAQARSGLMSVTGEEGGTPQRVSTAVSDVVTGILAALAVTAALRSQQATGEGTHIDVSLLDADLALLAPRISSFLAGEPEPVPSGATDSVLAVYQTFSTADRPIAVAIGNDRMWQRFCMALGLNKLGADPSLATNADRRAQRGALVEAINQCLADHPAEYWLELLRRAEVPSSAVQSLSEVVEDPQVIARRAIEPIRFADGLELGVVARPWRTDADATAPLPKPPPNLSEHAWEILVEYGYSSDEIARLVENEAVWLPTS